MLEPLIMQTRAPAPAAANGGLSAGSDVENGNSGVFENMLKAGLAGRTDSDAGTPMPTIPVGAKSAAKSAENLDASSDGPIRQPAEDIESTSLTALLAYSAGVIATILPAASRLLPGPAEPALAGSPTADAVSAAVTGAAGSNPKLQDVKDSISNRLTSSRLTRGDVGSLATPAAAASPPDATASAPVIAPPEPARAATSDAPSATPPVQTLRPAAGFALPRDPTALAAPSGAPLATASPPAQTVRPAAGFALPRDPTAPAASDVGTARTADSPAVLRAPTGPIPASNNAADERSATEGRPVRREDLRSPADTVVADPARQREDLMSPVQPAHSGQPGERPADRSADITARIDTLDTTVRADMTRGLDSFPAGTPERAGPVPVVYVEQSLASAGWKQEFGSQVTLLVSRREPQAEIRINPPELGPVEVRIGLQGDQLSLAFTAAHPDTRTAIENALPQLREMFAGNGLALGNASVDAGSSQQHSPHGTRQNGVSRPHEGPSETMPALRRGDMRLVDTFA